MVNFEILERKKVKKEKLEKKKNHFKLFFSSILELIFFLVSSNGMSTTIEMVSLRPNPQRIIEKSTKLK